MQGSALGRELFILTAEHDSLFIFAALLPLAWVRGPVECLVLPGGAPADPEDADPVTGCWADGWGQCVLAFNV